MHSLDTEILELREAGEIDELAAARRAAIF